MSETEVKVVKYPDRKNLVLRWIDPETGRKRTKSAKTTRRREAERMAAKLEADIKAGLLSGPPAVTWKEFKQAYQDDYLSSLADATFCTVGTTFAHVERILKPKLLKDLTGAAIATWQTKLRAEGSGGGHDRDSFQALESIPAMGLRYGAAGVGPEDQDAQEVQSGQDEGQGRHPGRVREDAGQNRIGGR